MATFSEANMARLVLKMKLSNYSWFDSSTVVFDTDEYSIMVRVHKLNNSVRKVIPPLINGVSVKVVH